jgi:hypothetical protein
VWCGGGAQIQESILGETIGATAEKTMLVCNVFSMGVYKLYLDGRLFREVNAPSMSINENKIAIGTGHECNFSGSIHKVAAWNTALVSEQVYSLRGWLESQ